MKEQSGTTALYALLFLAVLYTLYFAASLLIPIVLALLLSLQISPLVATLNRYYVPRAVSAALLLVAIGGPFTLLGMELVEPAQKWMKRVPEVTARVNEQLTEISEALAPTTPQAPVEQARPKPEKDTGILNFFGWFDDDEAQQADEEVAQTPPAPQPSTAMSDRLVLGAIEMTMTVVAQTPVFLAQCLVCIILVLFLLVYGPGIYNTAIEVLPQIRDKSQASQLVADTQRELSRYILTVSLINLGLGLVTAAVLWLMRFEDPLLWGAMVALLNFAPYVGTLLSLAVLTMAGLSQYGLEWAALLPAGAYFILNTLEAQLITPAVLGRNMQMNPLIIMLWLVIWGWLWGMAGVLIAVPLLVCIRLVLARSDVCKPWLRLIESRAN
ncbi:MAG: AI-2E family transporter [Halieaceae bacterium]|nr:AI-2E family transporter [Halieaceae bacterium]